MISVAICSRDRADSLDRTLESLGGLAAATSLDWELLVIDNASGDHTGEVISAHGGRLPIRALLEPEPGLSHARNHAVREARGTHIVFTDDDILVNERWLTAYAEAFEAHPDVSFFGGPIRARVSGRPPGWLADAIRVVPGAYGVNELGEEAFDFEPDSRRLPFGGNYAVRLDAHRDRPYDAALGRRPGHYVRGEETALMRSLLADGHRGRWVPQAIVQHAVTPPMQTTGHLRDYYARESELAVRDGRRPRPSVLEGALRAMKHDLRYRALRLAGDPERWITALVESAYARGDLR